MLRPLPPWIRKVIVDVHRFRFVAENIPAHLSVDASRLRAARRIGSVNAVVNVNDREGGGYRITTTFVGFAGVVAYPPQTADFGTEYELDLQLSKLASAANES
jgi:hypothetical protein